MNEGGSPSPTDLLSSIAIADREVLKAVRSIVLEGAAVTPEIAELLIELSLPNNVDADSYIALKELKEALGYSGALLSRRISLLCESKWVETKRIGSQGVHGNSQKVRITEAGRAKVQPIWERYEALAEELLEGISRQDREAHYRVNQQICQKIGGAVSHAGLVVASEPEPEFLD
jgi:DNA-binding MarR family transcriptional regulator